ncbi:MAG: hypothetical protein MUF34_37950, partial [Polyangiaceae bacterium]|nr:hypothetical protein [Polyangiaceae bacterium]
MLVVEVPAVVLAGEAPAVIAVNGAPAAIVVTYARAMWAPPGAFDSATRWGGPGRVGGWPGPACCGPAQAES